MMQQILIVEDNEDNQDLVIAFLEDQFALRTCVDGFETLALLTAADAYRPDLILCDISLPGMDGMALLRQLRSHPTLATIPAIALTSHAMSGDRERFLAAGFDAYISKPIMEEEALLAPILQLLAKLPSAD